MQINIYMLRPDLDDDDWGYRDVISEFYEVPTRPIGNLQLTLLLRQSDPQAPRWLKDLKGIAENDIDIRNAHGAALLLVKHRNYKFIIAYGTGRFGIDMSAVQPRFGLIVVANSVANSRVKSADTRELGGRSKSQRTVMPSAGPLYELELQPLREWVRQLEGRPSIDFASAVAGSDGLKMNLRNFGLSKLEEKLDQIIERFESSDYKAEYEFLDYFTAVQDKATQDDLNARVAGMIATESTDVNFAAPDVGEPLEVEYHRLRRGKSMSPELYDLDPEEVFAALKRWDKADVLKSVYVEAFNSAGDRVGDNRRLLDFVVTDVTIDESRYTLSAGKWFLIDSGFVDQVQKRIEAIPDLTQTLALEPWALQTTSGEGAYNEAAAKTRNWCLLDKKNFSVGGSYQKVEICDLLTDEKQLMCVKRMTQSSTLSHLFAQGLVSAQLLAADADGYRERLLHDLSTMVPSVSFGSNQEWTVIYAIATAKPGPLSKSLFFFSKVALDRTVSQLQAIGVKVGIARIPIEK